MWPLIPQGHRVDLYVDHATFREQKRPSQVHGCMCAHVLNYLTTWSIVFVPDSRT